MPWKTRLVLVLTMSSVMVLMVTLLVTYLNLGLPPTSRPMGEGVFHRLAGRGATGYFIMPPARRLTDRIVA